MVLNTLTEIEATGLKLYALQSNKWERLHEFTLPVRCVVLYDNHFKPIGLGVY